MNFDHVSKEPHLVNLQELLVFPKAWKSTNKNTITSLELTNKHRSCIDHVTYE